MSTTYRGVIGRATEVTDEPLLVRPHAAWQMLGCGNTHGYALLNAGELESFLDGRSRKITVASIHNYIARQLGKAPATKTPRSQRENKSNEKEIPPP